MSNMIKEIGNQKKPALSIWLNCDKALLTTSWFIICTIHHHSMLCWYI